MPTSNTSRPRNPEPDSPPELVEGEGGRNLRFRGRLLYSERGPELFAERLAAAAAGGESGGPARLYLLASPCLWHGVTAFLERLEEGSALLCLEAEPALASFALAHLPSGLADNPRLRFAARLEPEFLLNLAAEMGAFRRAVLVRLSGGAAFHEAAYRGAAARLDAEFIANWKNRPSLMALGRLWVRNTFSNLASLEEMDPRPLPRPRKPILVCGAGPSLESALPLLEGCRDRLFLLACDTALPPLASAGFLPDLAVCLEGQAHNLADFVPLGARDLPLLADLSSHPASFRALRGPKHLSLVRIKDGPFSRRLAALGLPALSLPPLGSVGVHALHVAKLLASDSLPVLASGLDFAFEAGKTHARGSPALLAEEGAQTRLHRWPRQIAASFRRGVRRASKEEAGMQASSPRRFRPPLLTDPVLSGYAELLAEEVSLPGPPVYDIRGRGLPLGAPALGQEEALSLIESWRRGAVLPPREEAGGGGAAAGATRPGPLGASFLAAELLRLEALEKALKGGTAPSPAELLRGIQELDYLLWPAPDPERVQELPQDLLNRVLVETEYWIWKLGEIIEALEERHVLPERL